ncbi:MAG: ACT domain-containing protein [Thermoplasmata archaeon]|nr:ACT domain-containing protein [Thermoplasmata archaeon]MCI4359148.1 ACT domain-containing protein [Thermoplasmata archaeon]
MAEEKGGAPTAAEVTRRYIDDHPAVRDCLGYNVVNFTALARKIRGETGLANQEAIEVACRRYQRHMRSDRPLEMRVLDVVKASRLEVRTRVAIITARNDWDVLGHVLETGRTLLADRRHLLQLLQGPGAVTILCEEDLADPVVQAVGRRAVLGVHRQLSAVTVRSPEVIVDTPGVLAFLAGSLFRAGINSLELMSVYTDSTFVVREEDVLHAFRVLSELVHPPAAEPGEAP